MYPNRLEYNDNDELLYRLHFIEYCHVDWYTGKNSVPTNLELLIDGKEPVYVMDYYDTDNQFEYVESRDVSIDKWKKKIKASLTFGRSIKTEQLSDFLIKYIFIWIKNNIMLF